VLTFVRDDIARPAFGGRDADRYVPLLWTLFLFILACNLLGLVPLCGSATGSVFVTLGLAVCAFFAIHGTAVRRMGLGHYVASLWPHFDLRYGLGYVLNKLRAFMDDARRDAQDARDRVVAEGEADIQAERDRARRELSTAREQAVQELWGEAARLATLVSARVIDRSLDDEGHRALIDEAVSELHGAAATPARVAERTGADTRSHP
jgi:hypothetical protein